MKTAPELLRKVVERVARRALKAIRDEQSYESVLPVATYAPWNSDDDFAACFRTIEPYTKVDRYRCYELWSLIEQTASVEGALLEVGVWRGGTGALIARRAHSLGIADPVYLCDTFAGMVKTGVHDPHYRGGELADTSVATVKGLVEDTLALDNVTILQGIFPDETGDDIKEQRFRFCHVDVDVYESAKDVLDWVWPKLSPGGVVVYDDYGFPACAGVVKHVDEEASKPDRLFVHNLNGHAIFVKLA